jgi:nitrogen fixation/metabolism regulation signal transduction histidine kinase
MAWGLLMRGSALAGSEAGFVVVFDDITQLIQAQRFAAWGEVARRLAHEIKNPLTPIQLSAERLAHRLADKLLASDADMLARSTQTIVKQVAQLEGMVDAFSQYARAPETSLQALDLNTVVREVLTLYEAQRPAISLELDAALPAVQGDPARLRQVIHNLLQNAGKYSERNHAHHHTRLDGVRCLSYWTMAGVSRDARAPSSRTSPGQGGSDCDLRKIRRNTTAASRSATCPAAARGSAPLPVARGAASDACSAGARVG